MPVRERTGDHHSSPATQGYHNARLRFPHRLNRDQQLGHFPQAFSHLSLIKAATNLDYQLKLGAGLGAIPRASGSDPPMAFPITLLECWQVHRRGGERTWAEASQLW